MRPRFEPENITSISFSCCTTLPAKDAQQTHQTFMMVPKRSAIIVPEPPHIQFLLPSRHIIWQWASNTAKSNPIPSLHSSFARITRRKCLFKSVPQDWPCAHSLHSNPRCQPRCHLWRCRIWQAQVTEAKVGQGRINHWKPATVHHHRSFSLGLLFPKRVKDRC